VAEAHLGHRARAPRFERDAEIAGSPLHPQSVVGVESRRERRLDCRRLKAGGQRGWQTNLACLAGNGEVYLGRERRWQAVSEAAEHAHIDTVVLTGNRMRAENDSRITALGVEDSRTVDREADERNGPRQGQPLGSARPAKDSGHRVHTRDDADRRCVVVGYDCGRAAIDGHPFGPVLGTAGQRHPGISHCLPPLSESSAMLVDLQFQHRRPAADAGLIGRLPGYQPGTAMRLMTLQRPILPAPQLRWNGNFGRHRGIRTRHRKYESQGMRTEPANALCVLHHYAPECISSASVGC